MQFAKTGEIANICQANALLTLKEYQIDYAKEDTKAAIKEMWDQEFSKVPNPKVKVKANEYIKEIENGKRDFRF
jgi:2-iminoacetate synthase